MSAPGPTPSTEGRDSNHLAAARASSARRTMLVLFLAVCLIVLIRLVVGS